MGAGEIAQFSPHWTAPVLSVIALFLVGQSTADYALILWLVGDRVGLHPLWVIFSVFASGTLFGFAGMLIAVPACAVIGVLVRFWVARSKASALYVDGGPAPSGHPPISPLAASRAPAQLGGASQTKDLP